MERPIAGDDSATTGSRVDVDTHELAALLEALSRYGRDADGALYRPVYSPAWCEAQRFLAQRMAAAGLAVHTDAAGNLFGRLDPAPILSTPTARSPLPSSRPPPTPHPQSAPSGVVLAGSHLDTVKHGGPLDGAYGVCAALLAVAGLRRAHGPPRRPLEVVAICEEEGSRFHANFWGSRAITGAIQPGEAESLHDADGTTMADAMRAAGLDAARLPEAERSDLACFLEAHVEQGPILEESGVPLGVVEAITGLQHLLVTVEGRQDHAGTTPMDRRHDALVGAAEMVLAIEAAAHQQGAPAVATVGRLECFPGATNIVPGRARFTIDVRHTNGATLARLAAQIRESCAATAARRGLAVHLQPLAAQPPVRMDAGLVALLERCARARGWPSRRMASGAGHDAQLLARRCPAVMLFVPSRGGRSHTPEEYSDPQHLARGATLLADALFALAYALPLVHS